MPITLEIYELKNLMADMAELGAQRAIKMAGLANSTWTKAKACRAYGRTTVERWIQEGLIKPVKDGNHTSSFRFDPVELEAVSKASNRASYLSVEERNQKK